MKILKYVYAAIVIVILFMAVSTVAIKQIERDKWHKHHKCQPASYPQYQCDFGKVVLP